MTAAEAEAEKELGNKAFGSKDYETAISHYTNAIKLDGTNHVFYSNRSACHASNSPPNFEEACKDAKKCIELSPDFIKGYYRLANAQIQLKLYDDALVTVNNGLEKEKNNPQLLKLKRTIKQLVKAMASKSNANKNSSNAGNNANAMARNYLNIPSNNKEVMDLQQQLIATTREYNTVKANLAKSQREQKLNSLTTQELSKLDLDSVDDGDDDIPGNSEGPKMYRSVGKMFMLTPKNDVLDHLSKCSEEEQKKEIDYLSKLEYLERRMKSQQANIQELIQTN